ncbi:hypothetical protein K504DRAFT_505586 [Pleomassaria siparia CBS 279.74]|uniref:Uncharacterized protein n=1 Tax=Pleomassaria siparia CBS 279.74 TaxID=1314801 RepID=A0A6G1JZF1_9PLEO|nr:hypothetical protein K504DRAFT_505586 [Pleomassaria siparia CBS 279.74]
MESLAWFWSNGKDNQTQASTKDLASQLDGASSERGESSSMKSTPHVDYEGGKTHGLGSGPEHMDTSQVLDSPYYFTGAGAGAASREPDFMDHDQQQGRNHEHEGIGHFGTEEEHTEADRMLSADSQLIEGAAAGDSAFPNQNQHQQSETEARGLPCGAGKGTRELNEGSMFDNTNTFAGEAASDGPMSMDLDSHRSGDSEKMAIKWEPMDAGLMFHHQSQYPIQNHQVPHRQHLGGELVPKAIDSRAAAQMQYHRQQLPGAFQPQASGSSHDFGTPASGTVMGQHHGNVSAPRYYLHQSQNTLFPNPNASAGAIYGRNYPNSPNIRHLQGTQNTGFGYGNPAPLAAMGTQDGMNKTPVNLYSTPGIRVPGPNEPKRFLSPPHSPAGVNRLIQTTQAVETPGQLSGNPKTSAQDFSHQPLLGHKFQDEVIELSSDEDSSDDEPLQSRRQRNAASASQESTSAFESLAQSPSAERAATASPNDDSAGAIDFRLSRHEAIYEMSKDGRPFAKVSLPGIVREGVWLSPDHSELEYQLFVNVFLPAQLKLPDADPEPAIAILNFHTICILVMEAYQLLQDEEGVDPKDADADDMFFTVIDKWRAGRYSNKEGSKLIRGVQEFCDYALDLVFWIKEHGLSIKKKRKERADKGTKRGTKAEATDEGGEKGLLATKTAAIPARQVNVLQPRKREKAMEKATPAAKGKAAVKNKPKVKVKAKSGRGPGRPPRVEKKEPLGMVTVIQGKVEKKMKKKK